VNGENDLMSYKPVKPLLLAVLVFLALSLKLCCMGQNHEENPARQGFAVISS
jgi:hypothetical protein